MEKHISLPFYEPVNIHLSNIYVYITPPPSERDIFFILSFSYNNLNVQTLLLHLIKDSLKLYMLAYYHMEHYILLQQVDRTIFVIVLFFLTQKEGRAGEINVHVMQMLHLHDYFFTVKFQGV
jgi:hypothetical protein